MRIILVEPHYPDNVGLIARTMKNFSEKELYLVNPHFDPFSIEVRKRAMHARDVLEDSVIVPTLDDALKGIDFSIATTARLSNESSLIRPVLPIHELDSFLLDYPSERIALVFGPEPSGLTNEDLTKCSIAVTIPTSEDYPSLNLAVSVAIFLFYIKSRLMQRKKLGFPYAPAEKKSALISLFNKTVDKLPLFNKDFMKQAFENVIKRNLITKHEASLLMGYLSTIDKIISNFDLDYLESIVKKRNDSQK